MAMAIKAIITDLGGVLISVDRKKICAKLAQYSSLPAKEICECFSATLVMEHEAGLARGVAGVEQFYREMVRKLRLDGLSCEEFVRIYSDRFSRKEDSLALLKRLSRRYLLAMLSNTSEPHRKYWLIAIGLEMELFKALILSFEVHMMKPEPAIYLEAARRLGVKPEECVFIDDVPEYVKGAEKAGMKGIVFRSAGQLETDLNGLGVLTN